MKVRDAMARGVTVAAEQEEVRSVVEKMISRRCGAVPVVDDKGDLIGIVTIRDIMLPLYPNYGDYVHDEVHLSYFQEMEEDYPKVLDMKVKDVMTENPLRLSPEDLVLKAASQMGVKNLRRMPVCEGDKLVGMISIGDINRALFMSYVESIAERKTPKVRALANS